MKSISLNFLSIFILLPGLLLTLLFGFSNVVLGQDNLYLQNFGTGILFPAGWNISGTNIWIISTSNSSTPVPPFSGGSNLSSGDSNDPDTITYSNNLSTVGYSEITILWGARKIHDNSVTCEWSPDNITWSPLTFTDVNNGNWLWINNDNRIELPAEASGVSNLSFRWTYDSDGTAGRYRIDDFSVEGCPLPAQPDIITGSTTPCVGSAQNYSVTNVAGVTYTWTFPTGWTQTGGGTTNSVIVTVGTGSGNITVTPSNACGNGTERTLAVTTTTVPEQPSDITGSTSPCQGSSQGYSVTNVSGVTYNWTFPTGWSQTGGGTTNSVIVAVGNGSGNITVIPSNACGNGTERTLAVTTTTVPAQPSDIAGSASPCQGSSHGYSVTNVSGVTFNWTFPAGWTQTSGGMTNSITVTVGTGSGIITVIPSNACGNGIERTLAVTTTTVPATPSVIAGSTTPCQGQSGVQYTIPAISNADSYIWTYSGLGVTINGETNTVLVTFSNSATSGDLIVKGQNECGEGEQSSLSLSLKSLPNADFSFVSTCIGNPTLFMDESIVDDGNITSWNWDFSDGTYSNIQNPTHIFASIGYYEVQLIVSSNFGCTDTISQDLSITENLQVSVSIAVSLNPACINEEVTFTSTAINSGITPFYDWRINTISMGQNNPEFITNDLENGDKIEVYLFPSSEVCTETDVAYSEPIIMEINPIPDNSAIVAKPTTGVPYVLIYPGDTAGIIHSYQWYKNGELLADDTLKFYYEEDGIDPGAFYKVIVLNEFKCDVELEYTYSKSKSGLFKESDIFVFYPNPNSGEFYLSLNEDVVPKNAVSLTCCISEINGKLKYKTELPCNDQSVHLSGLNKGVYLLEVTIDNTFCQIRKLLIQ